jgi:hypothetical protein
MHILTGMLLAAIFRKGRGASILPMLRTGPVQTLHLLPGRVRFRVPSLVDCSSRANDLGDRLRSLEGVERVEVNAVTGSLLIRYRQQAVRPELLFAAIVRLLGLEKELEQPPRPAVTRELRALLDSLNRVVYDRTSGLLDFSSALLILMAAVGIGKVMRQGGAAMPAGFTLIWWGVHQLLGHGAE